MTSLTPHTPVDVSSLVGTRVILDADATFLDRNFLVGGAPWRLLRLPGSSLDVAKRWKTGDVVRPGEETFARTLIRQGFLFPQYSGESSLDDVDVVIPVHNNTTSLRQLLIQLEGLHVTVVDDGSPDPTFVRDCARQMSADLVRLAWNLGAASARNAGADATKRPFLCFVDDDVSFTDARHVLSRLRAEFQDPELGACAPRVRGGEGPGIRDRYERRFGPLDMGPRATIVIPGGPVNYVPTACLMVRRDAFGVGFDEELRLGEDVDFIWRLHDHEWLVRYLTSVEVSHRARTTWRGWWDQRVGYGRSSSELARRHGDRLAPMRADRWNLAAWLSVLAGRPAVALRIVRVGRDQLKDKLSDQADDPKELANQILFRTMIRSGGPLSRAVVRTYGLALLVAAIHPRLRRPALTLFAVGTGWRWRHVRLHVEDIPLAMADDAAYGVGVFRGAWRTRSLVAVTPRITKSTITLRDVLG
ncbi:MAG TPA: mycofactocin biosynthesis glycosyltransferase MftF, partial [Acidimicrobiales bacterium]